jgi:ATP-dependent DNA helicase RecQ
MGERKLDRYGDRILHVIRSFILEKSEEGVKMKGSTYLQTLRLYRSGLPPEEIARQRALSGMSIIEHLLTLYEKGEAIDLRHWVSPEETDLILGALPLFTPPYRLEDIFNHFAGRFSYDQIRCALAALHRKMAAG